MRINVSGEMIPPSATRVGDVFPVRGGRGMKLGHYHVVIAFKEPQDKYDSRSVVTLTINREGDVVGAGSYRDDYFDDKSLVGRVEGLDEVDLTLRSV